MVFLDYVSIRRAQELSTGCSTVESEIVAEVAPATPTYFLFLQEQIKDIIIIRQCLLQS